jgi:1-deoxy-D-xylulose-5-phosphate reductoisomerase
MGSLTFEAPDPEKFPALRLAREAGTTGGTLPAVLNAANEIAVPAFLDGRILFPAIWQTVEAVMKRHTTVEHPSLDEILKADAWARAAAREEVASHAIECP